MPLLLGALGPLLAQILRWLFLAKLASFIGRIFVMLGIGWATNEYLVEPLMDQVIAAWQGIPADVAMWISFFRVDECVSILMSAYAIIGAKQLFLSKRE